MRLILDMAKMLFVTIGIIAIFGGMFFHLPDLFIIAALVLTLGLGFRWFQPD